MNNYIQILNLVLKGQENIKNFSTEEIIDAANRFSVEGDNGRAIFLCKKAIEHMEPQYEEEVFPVGEDLLTMYLHKGSYEDLLGLYSEGFSSFTKAVQIAKSLYEFISPPNRAKYTSLCYQFIATHYQRLDEVEKAKGCYEFISELLEEHIDDSINRVSLNKAYSQLITIFSYQGSISKVVEYKRKQEALERYESNEC